MKCEVCGFEKKYDPDLGYEWCSEFCATVTDKEMAEFKALKPGEYGVWPCRRCGDMVEGELDDIPEKRICAECGPKVRLETCVALLREAQIVLPEGDLRTRIEAELQKYSNPTEDVRHIPPSEET